ncbi:hypothetical protein DAEQUDRAFT_38885 [Daedalea quercina L-15889]|uniref:Uncharacterized protein n=1 Tax=Daedalea quercina L-15889 TaxID=1314783 RepID=A0A165LG19_9APHY|nr:hypothetical protein DAEQUDRAFT_38885 [Daedalea quercina L-15889]
MHNLYSWIASRSSTTACWSCQTISESHCIPRLLSNTSLEEVYVFFYDVPPSMLQIESILLTLLSGITSPHLQNLYIYMQLQPPVALQLEVAVPRNETNSADYTAAFHAILHNVEGQLCQPSNTTSMVSLNLDGMGCTSVAGSRLMVVIESRIVTLFAPWLDHSLLDITLIRPRVLAS